MDDPSHSPTRPAEPSLTAPRIVLDTNVALDWLLFDDPSVATLAQAITQRRLQWIATAPMREELAQVLGGGLAVARGRCAAEVLRTWDRLACLVPVPVSAPLLRCRDADDQIFIDLALAAGARWLASRDRALLALGRRCAALHLTILRPGDWPQD